MSTDEFEQYIESIKDNVRQLLEKMRESGVSMADPHAGNMFVTGGKLASIDTTAHKLLDSSSIDDQLAVFSSKLNQSLFRQGDRSMPFTEGLTKGHLRAYMRQMSRDYTAQLKADDLEGGFSPSRSSRWFHQEKIKHLKNAIQDAPEGIDESVDMLRGVAKLEPEKLLPRALRLARRSPLKTGLAVGLPTALGVTAAEIYKQSKDTRAFAPLEGVEDVSGLKVGAKLGPVSAGLKLGMPNFIDQVTGLPIMESAEIFAHPAIREAKLLGAPQRALEGLSPQAVGLLREGVSTGNLVNLSGAVDVGPYQFGVKGSTFKYGAGDQRGMQGDIGVASIPKEDRPIDQLGMHPNVEHGLMLAMRENMRAARRGFTSPNLLGEENIYPAPGPGRFGRNLWSRAFGADEVYPEIDPVRNVRQGMSDVRNWWEHWGPAQGPGGQRYPTPQYGQYQNMWDYAKQNRGQIWQSVKQEASALPGNLYQRAQTNLAGQQAGAVAGYHELTGATPYTGIGRLERQISRLEAVIATGSGTQDTNRKTYEFLRGAFPQTDGAGS